MDWTLAIERNSMALKHIVASLFAMAGLSAPSLLPLWEKVSPSGERSEQEEKRRMRGVGRIADVSDPPSTPHPTSPSFHSGSATFSHKGRREDVPIARPTLPRRLHRAVLRLLRPAESAVRRLIVIVARGMVVPPSPVRPAKPKQPSIFLRNGRGTGIILPRGATAEPRPAPHAISLPLFDPLKRPFRRRRPMQVCIPRISYAGPFATLSAVKIPVPPTADDRLDATRLTLRLQALAAALDDLPAHARRLARWHANRDAAAKFLAPAGGGGSEGRARPVARPGTVSRPKGETERGAAATSQVRTRRRHHRLSPLRPGRPPGSLLRPDHEVHGLLTELHGLAFDVLEHPDTS